MKKFADWKNAPDWANWHTVDKTGVGCWWSKKPHAKYAEWSLADCYPKVSDTFTLGDTEWSDTLEARPTSPVTGPENAAVAPDVKTETHEYSDLQRVLDLAYEQSAGGKGYERHANGKPFVDQPIMQITRMVGFGFPAGQAQKKLQEAGGMLKAGRPEAAQAELLGAIVYCAAAWLYIEEGK